MTRSLACPLLCALLATTSASAGGNKAQSVELTLELTIQYRGDSKLGRFANRTLPASELKVGVYTDTNLFGYPRLLTTAVTDARGRVTLRTKVRSDKTLRLRLIADTPLIKTFRGAGNVFLVPHKRSQVLTKVAALKSNSLRRTITIDGGEFSGVLHVQQVAGGTLRYARRHFSSVKRVGKISASYPGWLGKYSYAPFAHRIVIKTNSQTSDTVAHETLHTVWYQTRGRVEYYWPLQHAWTKRAGNPSLAMSEGWAYAMAIPALNAVAARAGAPDLQRDHVRFAGERHFHAYRDRAASKRWDHDGEANVISALYDLWDRTPDAEGVDPTGADQTNGGPGIPGGVAAQRRILAAIQRNARLPHKPNLRQIWKDDLRGVFGERGRMTLRLNGIRVE